MTLEEVRKEFVFDCEVRKLSNKTIENYSRQLGYLFEYLKQEHEIEDIGVITMSHVKAFLVKKQRDNRTVNYLNDLLKAFKVFFRYAYEEGYTNVLVTEKIRNARGEKVIIRTFTESEMKRLSQYYSGYDFLTIRNRVIILMFLDTGIRMGELISLTTEQIKADHIIIKGKGAKERVVPKSPLLGKWLIKYMNVREAYFLYRGIPNNLFLSKNGKILGSSIIDRIIKDAGANCDISFDVRISAHTFRHTYAQYQLRHGLDIYTLSRLLGHESIAITQTYLNGIRDKEVLAQGQKTSPLMNM